MGNNLRRQSFLLGTAAALAILSPAVYLASCVPSNQPSTVGNSDTVTIASMLPIPTECRMSPEAATAYVGDRTCAGCHPEQAAQHALTVHARTLRQVSLSRDGRYFNTPTVVNDPLLKASFRPLKRGKVLIMEGRQGVNQAYVRLNYAVGSGKSGITYLSVSPDGICLMPRLTLFRPEAQPRWGWTPGLEPGAPSTTPLGIVLPSEELQNCLSCHSTALAISDQQVDFGHSRLNVGCERCHGPGNEHVRATRSKSYANSVDRDHFQIPHLGALTADQQMELCGNCHRALSPSPPHRVPDTLARLQPAALKMSACFIKGDRERLSCTTCHNPHQPKQTNVASYEAICKNCHSIGEATQSKCPVNPRSGCVGCHMGRERLSVFGDSVYTNHWIRRRPKAIWSDVRVGKQLE